ncbi:hypothetical protein H0H81_004874, partial [Sphagnurus paluster]
TKKRQRPTTTPFTQQPTSGNDQRDVEIQLLHGRVRDLEGVVRDMEEDLGQRIVTRVADMLTTRLLQVESEMRERATELQRRLGQLESRLLLAESTITSVNLESLLARVEHLEGEREEDTHTLDPPVWPITVPPLTIPAPLDTPAPLVGSALLEDPAPLGGSTPLDTPAPLGGSAPL